MLRYDHSENSMQFRTDAAERLRILSNGRVAIGDVTANSQLDVHGGDGISITNSGDTFLQSRTTGTTGTNYLEFKDSGGGSGAISYHHNGDSMRFKVSGSEKLGQYDLAYSWKIKEDKFVKNKLKKDVPPQFLFIERCLDLVQDEGRLAIVLPDGIFGNEQTSYIRRWLLEKAQIIAIIDIPLETFLPNTGTKTSVIILKKTSKIPDNYPIFMHVAEYCGHDRRGKKIEQDDIPNISILFHKWKKENKVSF